jgi:hypothetical protein
MNDVRPGWWSRNWKWAVPCGCLALVALAAAGAAGFVWLLRTAMTSSDAYRLAVERAVEHPAVVEALGEPVEPGWFVGGSVHVTGPTGDADLSIPMEGPKGEGTLFVVARKSAGEWSFERLELETDGGRIDLLEPDAPPAPGESAPGTDDAAGESSPAASSSS